MKIIQTKMISELLLFLKDIINHKNYYSFSITTVIFYNFEHSNRCFQNILKTFFEKYKITTKFILITNKFHKINNALRSRCLCIRIPAMQNIDKLKILHKCFKQYNLSLVYFQFIFNVYLVHLQLIFNVYLTYL